MSISADRSRVPKVAKSGGESQSPARRPGGPAARAHLPLNPPVTSHKGIAKNLSNGQNFLACGAFEH